MAVGEAGARLAAARLAAEAANGLTLSLSGAMALGNASKAGGGEPLCSWRRNCSTIWHPTVHFSYKNVDFDLFLALGRNDGPWRGVSRAAAASRSASASQQCWAACGPAHCASPMGFVKQSM